MTPASTLTPPPVRRRPRPAGRFSFLRLLERPLSCCLGPALLAAVAALTGCAPAPPPPAATPAPQKVVLDYRNGWYHKASGTETVEKVARHYKRDPKLVADINQQSGPYAVPAAGTMLYIPPYNDRDQVRFLLMRLQGRPELIPKTPWDPQTGASSRQVANAAPAAGSAPTPVVTPTPAPTPTPKPILPTAVAGAAPAQPKPAEPATRQMALATPGGPNNPLQPPAALASPGRLEPPPPAGMTETVIAEPTPAPRRGFFSRLFGGSSPEPAPKPVRRTVTPPSQPVQPPVAQQPSPGGYIWPVKGQLVATFRSGWHEACHGLEIAAPEGTPVCAARAGTVLLAQAFPGYGNLILVDHGDGYATAYGYTREMLVRAGQHVECGQPIGTVGRASQGADSRLHFQVRRNALPVDPLPFLKNN